MTFEEYDAPGFKTVNSIMTAGGAKVAWFRDSEGNILASDPVNGSQFVQDGLRASLYGLKRMVVRLRDYVEQPLDLAERYLLVKQVRHRVHQGDRRFTALQRLGQAPRSSLSRWTL